MQPDPPLAASAASRPSRQGRKQSAPHARREAPAHAPPTEIPAGLLLPRKLGRYTLFDHIGRGGMADIYLAQAGTGLGGSRLVVIKEVLPALAHSESFAEMLVSEAKLAARLNHANVAKVEDLGKDGGSLYIAMEYVEGLDLRELLRRAAKRSIPVPVEFSLRIVIEALRGLSFAHRARGEDGARLGIVHRDVSPSNLLLSFEGEVKVCDFGIARANLLVTPTPEDTIVGKAGYMSPEQARGDALDERADVFAAGIILWELCAGRRLYKAAEGRSLLDVAREARIPALSERGLEREAELHAIVARALRVDRDERYATAAAMLADLEEYTAAARMIASPIRFGEWLMEHFGGEVVGIRRARERVMQALARGPAAVIEPIAETGGTTYAPTLPEYEMTPSAFPVALRAAGSEDAAAPIAEEPAPASASARGEQEREASAPEAKTAVAIERPDADEETLAPDADLFEAKVFLGAIAFAVIAFAMSWLATRM